MNVPPSSIYRWVASGIALVVLKVVVGKVLSLWAAFAKIKDYPGRVALWIDPFSTIGIALSPTFPSPGMVGYCGAKFSFYKKFRATSFASIKISTAQPYIWLSDPEAIKIVASDRHIYQKDTMQYKILNIYGGNVLTLEGADWKRHRSICMSAFNDANVALVWSETIRVINDWFDQLDADGPNIAVDMLHSMTEVTLHIIVSAAFGKKLSLAAHSTEEPPPGCKFPFQSAVRHSATNVIFRTLIPSWFYQLSSLIKVPYLSSRALLTQLAFDDLRNHMLDLVGFARAEIISGERSDPSSAALLRNLVEANVNQGGNSERLTEAELLSNIFTFLLAGHETSAHTLSFTFILLALHPDCQQKLYEEVAHVWPTHIPVGQLMMNHKEHLDHLEYTTAFIRETLRLFPVVGRIRKNVHTDTVLPGTWFDPGSKDAPSVATGKFSMAIPAGSLVVMDIWGMHLNPLHWGEDAKEFKPERFIDTESYQWPRHAYLPFSGGPRSCIGQRFAIAEMVGIIASVVRRYQVVVPDEIAMKAHEEQTKALLAWTTGLTLTPLNAQVKLCHRV